jgi:hypothetical protein
VVERTTKSKGKKYTKVWIYVPIKVAEDSNFPFKGGEEAKIKINLKNECWKFPRHDVLFLGF